RHGHQLLDVRPHRGVSRAGRHGAGGDSGFRGERFQAGAGRRADARLCPRENLTLGSGVGRATPNALAEIRQQQRPFPGRCCVRTAWFRGRRGRRNRAAPGPGDGRRRGARHVASGAASPSAPPRSQWPFNSAKLRLLSRYSRLNTSNWRSYTARWAALGAYVLRVGMNRFVSAKEGISPRRTAATAAAPTAPTFCGLSTVSTGLCSTSANIWHVASDRAPPPTNLTTGDVRTFFS